jgi:hypothetical protein
MNDFTTSDLIFFGMLFTFILGLAFISAKYM